MDKYARALGMMGELRARQVFNAALNKVGDKGRTKVKRALAQATGVKYGVGMRTIRSTPGSLQYVIEQPGVETNLALFGARQGARGVSARPWGVRRVFPSTFTVAGWGTRSIRATATTAALRPLSGARTSRGRW